MGAKARAAALARLQPRPDGPPLLAVATGPYVGEGFDCPALDTLFLAAPIAFKGRLVQYAGRVLRPHPGKITAEVHDYHDAATGVLASSLAKRAPGYTSLGFPRSSPERGHVRRISSQRRSRQMASAFARQPAGLRSPTTCIYAAQDGVSRVCTPKMPGEPMRVQPSRAKTRTSEDA
jgi:superfamily II DNA or RNA helicase